MNHGALRLGALLAAPEPALAHSPIAGIDTQYSGLLHSLFVPAHFLLLIAHGLFVGKRGLAENQRAIATFLGAILVGLTVASFDFALQLELALLAVAALVGLMIASNLLLAQAGVHLSLRWSGCFSAWI